MKLLPVDPLPPGPPVPAFVHRTSGRSGLEMVVPTRYPASPEGDALRELRLDLQLGIGVAARRCGLSPVEWSGLENGKYTLSVEDWTALRAKLSGAVHAP